MADNIKLLSVSEVNRAVREVVEGAFNYFWVGGEIGSLLIHRSGHVYFTLKDDKSQIRGCWFGGAAEARKIQLANGALVEALGRITVYEVRGEYQFSVRQMRPAGLGMLQRRFEELKNRLGAEGLFAPERKKPIPLLPERIGVVTSPSGAAIRDFLQIVNRRFPNVHVTIYPCQVQGATAAREVAQGIAFFNRTHSADVIVVTRGGGSMEDLWPFNEEIIARTIARSRIPVVSAVGHEIDFTICDFAADLRVPTPSAAAELVIGRREELTSQVAHLEKGLNYLLQEQLNQARFRLDRASNSYVFREPQQLIEQHQRHLDELELRLGGAARETEMAQRTHLDTLSESLHRALAAQQQQMETHLQELNRALQLLDPHRELERGFSLVFDPVSGHLVTSSQQKSGCPLEISFADGKLSVTAN